MAIGDGVLVPALIFGGIGLFLVGAGVREGYRALRLWRRRPVQIGSLDQVSGTVTVAGTATRLEETVRAPLSGTDCLGYAWRVLGIRTVRGFDGRVERSYHQLARGQDAVRFRLTDESGSVTVDPRGASLRLTETHVEDPASDPVDRGDVRAPGIEEEGPRQYYESRIDDGETVVVQGTVQPAADGALDVERVGVQLSGRGLYIADTDRSTAVRRGAVAAAVSLALGLAALGGFAVVLLL